MSNPNSGRSKEGRHTYKGRTIFNDTNTKCLKSGGIAYEKDPLIFMQRNSEIIGQTNFEGHIKVIAKSKVGRVQKNDRILIQLL